MIAILTSLFVLSLLVLVHELGHFLAAKKAGIKVEEFGLGYPPRLKAVKIGETIYSLNAIPFGGFVRIYGTEDDFGRKGEKEAKRDKKRAFGTKSLPVRACVLFAGIFMNFLLAVLAFSLIYFSLGIPQKQGFVRIVGVAGGSPAEQSGMREGDVIKKLKIENEKLEIESNQEFIGIINQNLGQEIALEIEREEEILLVEIAPREKPPEGEGPLGVAISDTKMSQPAILQRSLASLWFGLQETISWAGLIFLGVGQMIYDLLFRSMIPQDITGPVGIVQIAANVVRAGVFALLQLIGILSVNLAVLNFLPIPALDGGRLLFLAVEAITGKKPQPKVEKWVHMIGLIILLILMLAVTIQDVRRISSGFTG
jgi:regulator of sigma E protease